MPRARRAARWTGLGLGLGLGLGAGGCTEPPASAARGASPLVVERGPLAPRLLLTGELEAVESDELLAPQTDNWAISIRWMALHTSKMVTTSWNSRTGSFGGCS